MKFVVLAFVVAACSTAPDHGLITAKYDVAAYDSFYQQPIYMGESCYGSGANEVCTPRYIYMPETIHHDRACYITLSLNEQRGDVWVDCASWASLKVGDEIAKGQLR